MVRVVIMQEFLKLYKFKFTLLYSVGFFVLGGMALSIPGLVVGLLIDRIMNKCCRNRKDYPIKYWFIYFGLIGILYPIIIFSAIDLGTSSGLIYNWINFTEPFTKAMANLIPAIDIYAKQIAAFGDSWRVPKFRHLYAVFWFTNIVAGVLLYAGVWDLICYFNLKETVFKFDKIKKNPSSFKKLNLLLLCGVMFFGLMGLWLLFGSYFGTKLPYITYLKGYYIFEPFILFLVIYSCASIAAIMVTLNVKYVNYRRKNNA